jgi:hypothetical protein
LHGERFASALLKQSRLSYAQFMLPILRFLPVGGVLLAILILLLALTPPGGVRRVLPDVVLEARGPLIDRDTHPEWRQFLIQAALQRADEIKRLRDLPDTPVVRAPDPPAQTEIVIPLPAPVTPTQAPVPSAEEVAAPPPQPMQADVTASQDNAAAEPAPSEPAPRKAAPAINAEDAPRIVAALPSERSDSDPDNEDVTGSINELPGATIPIDIGETSSTELPVTQPEERPPVMRMPERAKPPRDSKNKSAQPARRAKAKAKGVSKAASRTKQKTAPKPSPAAQLTLFEVLFGSFRPQQRPPVANTPGGADPVPPPAQASAAAN